MNKFKKISAITLGGVVLFASTVFAKTGTVNAPSGLILRKEASKSGAVIMEVKNNANVEIIEETGEWYKVKYNDTEGYLFAEYVNVEEEVVVKEEEKEEETTNEQEQPSEETPTQKYPQNQKAINDLKVYTIPSVTAKTMGNVQKDSEITINFELNNWVNITYGQSTGWVRKYFVNTEIINQEENKEEVEEEKVEEEKKEEAEKKEEPEVEETVTVREIDERKGYVNVNSSANIRKEPNTSSAVINTLLRNSEVTITGETDDFYRIKYNSITGYISKSLISDNPVEVTSRSSTERRSEETQEEQETADTSSEESSAPAEPAPSSGSGDSIASYARGYEGYRYTYGGTTPGGGFDCSGFTYYVYNSCGYSLSRSCQVQSRSGVAVSRSELQPGDLVFFNNGSGGSIGHVAIYIGGGQIVHAENSRTGVVTSTINSGYYNKYYYSARRIVN